MASRSSTAFVGLAMAGYAYRVKREIARWSAAGHIDPATAEILVRDIEARVRARVNFASIFAMMAAALLGASVLIFVAANWEAIPRLARLLMLFLLIVAGYVGGAILKLRDHPGFGEAAWVVAATSFGASIALVAQMYHLTGDERTAILTWCAGTVLAALVLRSSPLTIGAVLLSVVWMLMHAADARLLAELPFGWLAIALGLWLCSYWTRSAPARHLMALALVVFAFAAYVQDQTALVPVLVAMLGAALYAMTRAKPDAAHLVGLGGALSVHGFIFYLSAMVMLHFLVEGLEGFVLVILLVLAGIVAALMVAGRESTLLRWLAYGAFVVQLCHVYIEMLGTMMGTAGFFLVAGLALGAVAWIVTRIEGSFRAPPAAEAAT